MYVCIYLYIYTHIHIYIYLYIHIHIPVQLSYQFFTLNLKKFRQDKKSGGRLRQGKPRLN